ncbi:FSH1-domain-containing protein, partial [Mycena maculata]
MKRVLALHGHSQSAHCFKYKLDAIRDACQDSIELVFVDAPHILSPVDHPGAVISDSSMTLNGHLARAWWRFLYDMRDASTIVESFRNIQTVLETQGPFQGILGFSQGAAFASMILGYMEYPDFMPHLLSKVNHPPFEFAVMISGFLAPGIAYKSFPLPPMIHTPSLHIIGFNDTMVSPEQSIQLSSHFDNPRVEIHEGGHFIPRKHTWRRFLCDYLSSQAS